MKLGGHSVPVTLVVTHTVQCVESLVIVGQHDTMGIVNLALVTCQFYTRHFTATMVLPPCSTAVSTKNTESVTVEW